MMNKQSFCLDSNIFIEPWKDGYPPDLFPELWKEFYDKKDQLIFIKEIFDEINPILSADKNRLTPTEFERKYSLRIWLENNNFTSIKIDAGVEAVALLLEEKYGAESEDRKRGAGENDIKLIAYAKMHGLTLVTLENMQPQAPKEKKNYKIPLICREEDVECVSFIPFLRLLRGL